MNFGPTDDHGFGLIGAGGGKGAGYGQKRLAVKLGCGRSTIAFSRAVRRRLELRVRAH